ncbi:TonB-dependent receptor [Flavihumibacter petaseus]|uniref:Putative TonB-dependent receptor n=1 Tax=Flavihumibacter petaseus NBRC 106054 TaxID=1220578 RepID=A0A0E9MYM0_9BACT|nr:TonB-dependent receptor [Flavihumibacter petaseus]GAO42689.1 putative TonB-dependent receptor [Flavihumibacter petaseus NBRC 106054]
MFNIFRIAAVTLLTLFAAVRLSAQTSLKGKIIDSSTKEPVTGATVQCTAGCACGCATTALGEFELKHMGSCCKSFRVSSIGYQALVFDAGNAAGSPVTVIQLQQENNALQSVVVTANREGVKRSLAPVAVSTVSSRMIQETKPVTVDQVLNKVSGVYMVNLGNEQHSMSIRQPMTTKSLFLYLEDGIPIRTVGLFNHNALLEMNMASVKSIEVIKGPSSSLYGSEAIGGVVNFITAAPPVIPVAKISVQGNSIGYKRTDLQTGSTSGKWGFAFNGYYADKRNSFMEYTDFHKGAVTARVDYNFSSRTTLSNSYTYLDYYSDMTGGIDSAMYGNKSFNSKHTFTYRKVNAQRLRSTLNHTWNDHSKSTAAIVYRNNSIGQNPAYAVKDDYRRTSSGEWKGQKDLAHGEINEASFNSYAMILQHKQKLNWHQTALIGGVSADFSPSAYTAGYIGINRDSVSGKYTGYAASDSMLTHYNSDVNNYAAFMHVETSPFEELRLVASLRYDRFNYRFNNFLPPSAYSGAPDSRNNFSRVSPKVGFIWNFSQRTGIYTNYSEGFVPPQVTEMYKGVKVPDLVPSVFRNYEVGGWAELIRGKLSADVSLYRMRGSDEIVSMMMDDGSYQNRNAGETLHQGVELGVTANPLKSLSFRFSGALSKHRFETFEEKGVAYDGKEMNGAPRWMHNAEAWYRPAYINGLRVGIEWQKIGRYFLDPVNTVKFSGYDVFHFRAGYSWKAMEVWMNVMNAGDSYYAYTASKSNYGYSYTPGEPRNLTLGVSYDLGSLFRKGRAD